LAEAHDETSRQAPYGQIVAQQVGDSGFGGSALGGRRRAHAENAATSSSGDIYGHTSDATTRAAIDGLSDALGLS
jgi:hypothetical protein